MKKIMMKSKFNIDARFNIYSFFLFSKSVCMWLPWASYLFLHACILWLAANMPITTVKPSNGPAQINTLQNNYRWSPSDDGFWNPPEVMHSRAPGHRPPTRRKNYLEQARRRPAAQRTDLDSVTLLWHITAKHWSHLERWRSIQRSTAHPIPRLVFKAVFGKTSHQVRIEY